MFGEVLQHSPHLTWPLAAFILFFLVFVGVIVYLARGLAKKQSYDDVAALPLEEDEAYRTKGGSRS